jgi:hypothetical protein
MVRKMLVEPRARTEIPTSTTSRRPIRRHHQHRCTESRPLSATLSCDCVIGNGCAEPTTQGRSNLNAVVVRDIHRLACLQGATSHRTSYAGTHRQLHRAVTTANTKHIRHDQCCAYCNCRAKGEATSMATGDAPRSGQTAQPNTTISKTKLPIYGR